MTPLKIFIGALTLTACATVHAQSWLDHFQPKTSDFTPGITLAGTPKQHGSNEDRFVVMMFATVMKKTGELAAVGFGVLNTYQATSWRAWNSAATSAAQALKVDTTSRNRRLCGIGGCFLDEQVVVYISLAVLESAAKSPVRIRLSSTGSGGEFIFDIEQKQAQALMSAIADTSSAAREKR